MYCTWFISTSMSKEHINRRSTERYFSVVKFPVEFNFNMVTIKLEQSDSVSSQWRWCSDLLWQYPLWRSVQNAKHFTHNIQKESHYIKSDLNWKFLLKAINCEHSLLPLDFDHTQKWIFLRIGWESWANACTVRLKWNERNSYHCFWITPVTVSNLSGCVRLIFSIECVPIHKPNGDL